MEHPVTIRLDLGVSGQKFIQQVQLHNKTIEEQVELGINAALQEISNTEDFMLVVKNETVKQLNEIISKQVFSWELKNRITKLIEERIEAKVREYADKIAEQVTKGLAV